MTVQFKNFIYNEERGFIFAYVPKVACTNWKSLLRYMIGEADWLDKSRAHDRVSGGLHYLDLDGPEKALLSDRDIARYAMVREPYSRALSAYLDKVESRLPLARPSDNEDHFTKVTRDIETFRIRSLDTQKYRKVDFEVFLLWLRDSTSWIRRNEHWATQTELLHHPDLSFDILGRFENLESDARRILEAMGCDQRFPTQQDIKFAATSATSKLGTYLTPVCADIIRTLFEEDFVNFGYQTRVSVSG